jgi:hypothetical protein
MRAGRRQRALAGTADTVGVIAAGRIPAS